MQWTLLELSFAIFKDSLRDSQCNDFFDMVLQACQQLEMQSVLTDLMNVREPVCMYVCMYVCLGTFETTL